MFFVVKAQQFGTYLCFELFLDESGVLWHKGGCFVRQDLTTRPNPVVEVHGDLFLIKV